MRERTEGRGLATRAIHAGERPDPTTHAHRTPDLRDGHVHVRHRGRQGGRGRPVPGLGARRVLLLADREPDEPGARGEAGVARGRRGRGRLVVGHGRRRGDAVRPPDDGRPPRRGRRAVRDHQRPARRGLPAARHRRDPGRHDRPRRRRGGRSRRRTQRALRRDARRTRGCGSPTSTRWRRIARRHGLLFIADNTFLGPALLRPLEHGADLVLHAATKYLSGHGDAVSGVVSGPQGADRPDPQADRHARPGGQPVLELPRPARRPDAAASVAGRVGQRGARSPRSSRATRRSSGCATRASPRIRTTPSRAACWATTAGRW